MHTPNSSVHRATRPRSLSLWRTLALVFAAFAALTALSARAQTAGGIVSGSVIDTTTGKFLEGAEVAVEGTTLRTTTEREGRFVLRDVPAGPRNILVSYPGMEVKSASVTVTAGATTPLDVRLGGGDIVTLTQFKVAGTKEGMSQAIALQKVADNTKVVAAGDQFGDIAEGNAAEYIKFLPGVGIDYNANDARAATLRGMGTQFTNVTMNGNPLASATSGNLQRRFEFEQVAINNVETIEVYKTLTPEMQATSTGGSINLVTKSAFDRAGSLATYRAYIQATGDDLYLKKTEGWGQEQTRKILPGFDFNYAARLRENLGINLAYKNSQLFNDYPRSSYAWNYNPANGGSPTNPWINSWNLQNEQKDTRRQTLSGQVDWKPEANTKVSFQGGWNFYDLLFTDRTTTVTPGAKPALSTTTAAAIPAYNGTYTGPAGGGNITFQEINRWKSGVTWNAGINATHDFASGSKLEGSTYWSQAYSKYRDVTGSWFSDVTIQRGGQNPSATPANAVTEPLTVQFTQVGEIAPRYTLSNAANTAVDLRDVSQFEMIQARSRPQTGYDTRYGGGLDYKQALDTKIPLSLKVGGRLDYTDRNIDNRVFNRQGTSALTGFGGASAVTGQKLVNLIDTGFSNHPIGYGLPAYNFPSVYRSFDQLGGLAYLPYTPASDVVARFEDSTKAGYVRLDVKPSEKFLAVVGVRYEDRRTDIVNRQTNLAAPLPASFSDASWFPSVNLKYNATSNLLFRFGYAKSIGLPDYQDILPGAPTKTEPADATARGKIAIFNPNLKPYKVDNFDLSVEYYFSRSGFVSASVFRKTFTNAIITATQALDANTASELGIVPGSLGSPLDRYDVTYNFNVPDKGSYNGIELNGQQNLTFLPRPFNTIVLQANATFLSVDPIKTNAVFSNSTTDPNLNAAILTQINQQLQYAAVKRAFNVSLNYSIGRFGFTVTSNYTGYVLKNAVRNTVKYSDEATNRYFFEYQYQAPRELVDVRIDYKASRRFTPYFQARNVLGRPIIMSTQSLPLNHAEYGDPIYELGVRGIW